MHIFMIVLLCAQADPSATPVAELTQLAPKNYGQLDVVTTFKTLNEGNVTLNRIPGATDGFDKGLDKQIPSKSPVDYYSSIPNYYLKVDARDPDSTTDYHLIYDPLRLQPYSGDVLFDLKEPFSGYTLFADIFKNDSLLYSDVNIASGSRYKVDLAPGDVMYINVDLIPVPEPATIAALGVLSLLSIPVVFRMWQRWRKWRQRPIPEIHHHYHDGYMDYFDDHYQRPDA